MVTREELEERYKKMPTAKLLEIIDDKFGYTEMAVSVALSEIGKRNVSEDEIEQYKKEQVSKVETFIKKNISDDLSFGQKNLFYFIWVPLLTIAVKLNFSQDGYVLKLKQANYYSLLGFVFFMVAGLLAVAFNFSDFGAIAIWILGFLLSYFFDEYFNRQRQIAKLQRLLNKDETGETDSEDPKS